MVIRYIRLLTVLLLTGQYLACDRPPVHEQQYTDDDTLVERGDKVEILYSDSAVVRVRITAPTLLNFSDRNNPRQEFPNGIRVEFLTAAQKIESTLTAKSAYRDVEKGQVIARDSVVMVTADKETLETEEITWDEKTAKIHTDKFVKVTQPGEIIYGFGLDAEQDFSYWKILVPKGRIKAQQVENVAQ
jgi:LPS export ABC transporter protein LptC